MLHLTRNQLTGPIPAALGDRTDLESLGLSDNELTGPIPTNWVASPISNGCSSRATG